MVGSTHDSTVRAILYAFLANLGIAIAKSWAAVITGSGSMLAEAIHSYADTGNQVLLYLGLKQSQRPPDADHPLGYGKLSYFWSFIVAILLFSMGGLFSIYEGYHKLTHPEPLSQIWIAIVVLVISVFVAWRVKSLLVGKSADPDIQEAIDAIICEQEGIDCVFNAITIQFGPDTMLAVKVKMNPALSFRQAEGCICLPAPTCDLRNFPAAR